MGLRDPLPAEDLSRRLSELDGWEKAPDREEIHRTFSVEYYIAVQAINEVMVPARRLQHHPDIDLRWETLHFSLTTYSAGQRITELDFLLAEQIDQVMARYTSATN
jgi:4a-hydroxytetrahydrobiopterin dehydratase